jgi:mannitol/fructose-specific phosphotransferase system IIA component (Ntr-type)/voltage-gated potassium channel Kch
MVAAALVVILLVKPLAALLIVGVLGYSVRTALTVALGLAQIGEFSFILADLAGRHGLLPEAGRHVLVASAILSITLNPFLSRKVPAIETWLQSKPRLWSFLNRRGEKRLAAIVPETPTGEPAEAAGHGRIPVALLVGYGPVGRTVHRVLEEGEIPSTVIDTNMDTVCDLRGAGKNAIFGDASNERILEEAGAGQASYLVVTLPDAARRAAIITAARNVNPEIRVVVRARYLREREELEQSGVTAAVYEEAEAAVALARLVLAGTGVHRDAARVKLEEIRFQLAIETFPDLRRLKVGAVMVPWSQVRTLSAELDREAARARIGEGPHQMLPVVASGGRILGYVLAEAFLADAAGGDWSGLIRPLLSARSEDRVGEVFHRMCEGDERICLIREGGTLLGIVTRGHLLDRVELDFARAQTVRPATVTLADAVVRGGVVPVLEAGTREEAIRELASAIPTGVLPPDIDVEILCERVFAREAEISTDLGNGIALPHARCERLEEPLVVIGRSLEGIAFSDEEHGAVRLFFLLVTPADRPETHLALLSQVARLVSKAEQREALLEAATPVEFLEVIGG